MQQAGFTLVELMVSLVIGLVVLAAMYSGYNAATTTTRTGRAVSQMSEDANAAMNILRYYVTAAGYSAPVGSTSAGFTRAAGTTPDGWLIGCDSSFADLSKSITQLTCSGAGSDAMAVAFEADDHNSVYKNSGGSQKPLDCLGNTYAITNNPGHNYYLSYSRFYVQSNALFCRGPGNAAGQALVENIEDMEVTYGVKPAAGSAVAQAYLSAEDVRSAGAWARVVSVRVCLVMRSADKVEDSATDYQGCDPFAEKTSATDRRMHRAFTSTFLVQNRRETAL